MEMLWTFFLFINDAECLFWKLLGDWVLFTGERLWIASVLRCDSRSRHPLESRKKKRNGSRQKREPNYWQSWSKFIIFLRMLFALFPALQFEASQFFIRGRFAVCLRHFRPKQHNLLNVIWTKKMRNKQCNNTHTRPGLGLNWTSAGH